MTAAAAALSSSTQCTPTLLSLRAHAQKLVPLIRSRCRIRAAVAEFEPPPSAAPSPELPRGESPVFPLFPDTTLSPPYAMPRRLPTPPQDTARGFRARSRAHRLSCGRPELAPPPPPARCAPAPAVPTLRPSRPRSAAATPPDRSFAPDGYRRWLLRHPAVVGGVPTPRPPRPRSAAAKIVTAL